LARLGVETGSEKPEQVYLVARRRGVVDCLDAASGSSRPFFQAKVEDGEELVGLKTAAGGKVLSCSSKGKVEIWVHQDLSDSSSEEDSLVCQTGDGAPGPLLSRSLAEISASAPVETFEVCPRGLTFATGGRENNAKLFDVETQKNVFQARSPKPNQLGIWDKPWITSLCFLDQSSSKVLLCGTANHQLRLYDTRVKRRPIFEIEWGENKITSLCLHPEEGANRANASGVWCGSAIGQLAMLDLKMKAMNGSLKGTLGSVRDLYMHPTKPLLFSCGLDRFLRVYDVQKRQQVCRVFLKQYTNAVKVAMPEEVLDKLLLTNTKDDEDVENDHRRDLGSHRRPKPSKKGPSKKKRKL
jgi:ribosome biogenesis protein NSA1